MRWILFSVAGFLLAAPAMLSAQFPGIQYARGQDVTPAFEGWQHNQDGTFTLIFGYMNRNYEEEVDVPVGPNNTIDPGGDRGQPTHFYPRRQRFVFKVVVPKDWGPERKLVWTLTAHGRTNAAKGWLQPEWEVNNEILMENLGGGIDLDNQPPSITGSSAQTVTLPNPATLTATAEDDGRPKPRRAQNTGEGLSIRWIQYRGPGPVRFDPAMGPSGYGKPVTSTTKVSFSVPGTYVLRAIASDGALEAVHDVTVTVNR
jgi:hypothetical protein